MDGTPAEAHQRAGTDESRLLTRHCGGDPRAFGELIDRFRARIYGYLVRCGVDPAARDDLFQEIFIKIHGAAPTYRPDRALAPWIFTIVANTVRSWYRKQKVRRIVVHDGELGETVADASPANSPHQSAEAQQTATWMADALAALPLDQREVIILSCIEEMDTRSVALVLDMPEGTVKTHLRRGRITLTRALGRRKARIQHEVDRGASS